MAAPIRTSISVKPASEPGRERAPGVRRRRRPYQLGGVRLDSGMRCQTPSVLRHSDAAALAKGVAAAHWASSADGASGDRAADGRPTVGLLQPSTPLVAAIGFHVAIEEGVGIRTAVVTPPAFGV